MDTERARQTEEIALVLPRQAAQLARLLARRADTGIPRGMASLLAGVAERPRSITQLAEREGVAQPTMSRMVDRLEGLGLLKRTADATDGRAVRVDITRKGERQLERIRARYREVFAAHLRELDAGEVAAIATAAETLQRLVATLTEGEPATRERPR